MKFYLPFIPIIFTTFSACPILNFEIQAQGLNNLDIISQLASLPYIFNMPPNKLSDSNPVNFELVTEDDPTADSFQTANDFDDAHEKRTFYIVNSNTNTIYDKLTLSSSLNSAKAIVNGEEIATARMIEEQFEDTINNIREFNSRYYEGKVYVNCVVENDTKNGIFVLERAGYDMDFEAVGFKKRIGTKVKMRLLYSLIDEKPFPGNVYYRILQLGDDGSYRYSDVEKVVCNNGKKNYNKKDL
ncbi:MAG: hypothetical protein ABII90_01300 [Bacteroidota bacterium]